MCMPRVLVVAPLVAEFTDAGGAQPVTTLELGEGGRTEAGLVETGVIKPTPNLEVSGEFSIDSRQEANSVFVADDQTCSPGHRHSQFCAKTIVIMQLSIGAPIFVD
jgi:hypothetical protein